MKRLKTLQLIIVLIIFLVIQSCKTDPEPIDPLNQKLLLIENDAQALNPGDEVQLSAVVVDVLGNVSKANVTWSIDPPSVASVNSSAKLTALEQGEALIKATLTEGGQTYFTEIPLIVRSISIFDVVPGAVVWGLNEGTITLTPVYFGNQNPTFSFESSDNTIATVSTQGEVNFISVGSCSITVKSDLPGEPSVDIPILVQGEPEVDLPLAKLTIEPKIVDLFRLESQQFQAKAYNSSGEEVSTAFDWSVENPFDEDLGEVTNVISVNENGLVTAQGLGIATLTVFAKGYYARAKVIVNPDTLLIIDPLFAMVPPGNSRQLNMTPYRLNHDKSITEITEPIDFTWVEFGDFLDDFSIDQTGLVSVHDDASLGNLVSILAVPESPTINLGMSLILALPGSNCECGDKLAEASSIEINTKNLDLSILSGQQAEIIANVKDASGAQIDGASVHYCIDSETIATVDSNGVVTPISLGNATITVCHGSLIKEVSVNVTL